MEDQKVKNFINKVYKFKEMTDELIQRDVEGGRQITIEKFPKYEEISMDLEESIKELEEEIK